MQKLLLKDSRLKKLHVFNVNFTFPQVNREKFDIAFSIEYTVSSFKKIEFWTEASL
jgi:hypothetical protein